MMFDDGLIYVGGFRNDMFHGEALVCLPFGSVLIAHFEKNVISGTLSTFNIVRSWIVAVPTHQIDSDEIWKQPDGRD